jgi:hypothetical protein
MYTLKTNRDVRLPKQREEGAPTARRLDGMGVRERSFSRSWVEPIAKERASSACSATPGLWVSFPLTPATATTVSIPFQARGPPLDSKEFQMHKLTLTQTPLALEYVKMENRLQGISRARKKGTEGRGERAHAGTVGLKKNQDGME